MIEKNNKQKILTKTDLPAEDLKVYAAFEVEEFFKKEIMLSKEEFSRGLGSIKDETIQSVFSAIDPFLETNRDIQPIEVESHQDIAIPMPDGQTINIRYVMDLEIENGIIDYKFTGKPKTQRAIDEDSGLTIYALAYFAKHGKLPKVVRFHNFISRYTPVKRELKSSGLVLNSYRTIKDFEVILERIKMAIKAIQNGVFLPAPVGAWNCSPKWCGYFETCQYVNYERICAAEDQEKE